MLFLYLKALHVIFVVTWFAGMFYIVRLFIYNTEAQEKEPIEKQILTKHFSIMSKRLWLGITFPSAILTLILGPTILILEYGNAFVTQKWLLIKLIFVLGLYMYFLSLHKIFKEQQRGIFKYSGQKLRIWNEVATIFLIAIVMLAVVKSSMSWVWGLVGLLGLMIVLMSAIKIYKSVRSKKD